MNTLRLAGLRPSFTLQRMIWAVVACGIGLEFCRWIRVEWLGEVLFIVGVCGAVRIWGDTLLRALVAGASAGAIGFAAGFGIAGVFVPSLINTPAGEFIFPIMLVGGGVNGGIAGIVLWL